ncbi:hypothetical protein KAW65_05535 [candidate division WOR-3 bacterium]|nr:hypothetical protein [candidate division WOR-3 bacterium]
MINSILNLDKLVGQSSPDKQQLFSRIFSISKNTGKLIPPEGMSYWIKDKFGSLNIKEQVIVRVENLVTYEGTLFNKLRSKIPIKSKAFLNWEKELKTPESCAFCDPLNLTPKDDFGRIKGKYCITASNVAKYDWLHGLIIFDEHYPLVFDKKRISDYLQTAIKWLEKTNKLHKEAIFPFIMWNCNWRAGASIIHGHLQILLAKEPYPKIKFLKEVVDNYNKKYGANYWQDLFQIHKMLGLGVSYKTIDMMAYLTPLKENEIMVVTNKIDDKLSICLSKILKYYYEIGVRSFNLGIMMPPLTQIETWDKFPVIVRIVNRGDLSNKVSDIGAMELYTCSVVSSDPFKLFQKLIEFF